MAPKTKHVQTEFFLFPSFLPEFHASSYFMNGASFHLVIKNLNCHKFLVLNVLHVKFYQILSIQHPKISLITFVIFFPELSS